MRDSPETVRERAKIELALLSNGARREELAAEVAALDAAAKDLIRRARGVGLPRAKIASCLGVARPTVYTWERGA